MIDFSCPKCKKKFKAKDGLGGKQTACHKCYAKIIVPFLSETDTQPAPSIPAPSIPAPSIPAQPFDFTKNSSPAISASKSPPEEHLFRMIERLENRHQSPGIVSNGFRFGFGFGFGIWLAGLCIFAILFIGGGVIGLVLTGTTALLLPSARSPAAPTIPYHQTNR